MSASEFVTAVLRLIPAGSSLTVQSNVVVALRNLRDELEALEAWGWSCHLDPPVLGERAAGMDALDAALEGHRAARRALRDLRRFDRWRR
jgi:hypothetical protein